MKISGGAAGNPVLNQLKAEMFQIPVAVLEENDTSALGAVMVAAVGAGWYESIEDAILNICHIKEQTKPVGKYNTWLEERYSIYKKLYPAVRTQYKELRRIPQ